MSRIKWFFKIIHLFCFELRFALYTQLDRYVLISFSQKLNITIFVVNSLEKQLIVRYTGTVHARVSHVLHTRTNKHLNKISSSLFRWTIKANKKGTNVQSGSEINIASVEWNKSWFLFSFSKYHFLLAQILVVSGKISWKFSECKMWSAWLSREMRKKNGWYICDVCPGVDSKHVCHFNHEAMCGHCNILF